MKRNYVYYNGDIISEEKPLIQGNDPGLLFGYGLFETVRVYNYSPFMLREHLQRLYTSAVYFNIDLKITYEDLMKEIYSYIKHIKLDSGVFRLTVTKGVNKPNIIFTNRDIGYKKEDYIKGFSLKTASIKKNNTSITIYHKTLNYLGNNLAKEEAQNKGYNEALFVNTENKISECASSNIFFIKNNILYTPSIKCGILNGITRQIIIDRIAISLGLDIFEGNFTLNDLYSADEVFISNSVIEIMPIRMINQKIFIINQSNITKQIMQIYNGYVNFQCQ